MLLTLTTSNNFKYIFCYIITAVIIASGIFIGVRLLLNRKYRTAATHKLLTPGRFFALGFLGLILFGSLLLYLPITHNDGVEVSYVESLFTSTSAVCVTGLVAFDTADTFNVLGQGIIALLIQIGGLGIASIGIGIMALSGRRVNMRERYLVKEALNYSSFGGIMDLVKWVLITTVTFEVSGAVLSFFVFIRDYSFGKAVWLSIFHSIASFNNAGFDILGAGAGLSSYKSDVYMNIVTALLVIFGGLGFFALKEIMSYRKKRRMTLTTKVVLATTTALLVIGTILLKQSENITWLGAFFTSMTARTAGFSTYSLGEFSNAGLLIVIMLMFVGASPGSTGGGVKTTTFFVLISSVFSIMTNKDMGAFKRKFHRDTVFKAFLIFISSILICLVSAYLLCLCEPEIGFMPIFFETVSAFSTAGLSTGITAGISSVGKIILIITMYIGRIGPLTAVTLLAVSPVPSVSRAEENISVG